MPLEVSWIGSNFFKLLQNDRIFLKCIGIQCINLFSKLFPADTKLRKSCWVEQLSVLKFIIFVSVVSPTRRIILVPIYCITRAIVYKSLVFILYSTIYNLWLLIKYFSVFSYYYIDVIFMTNTYIIALRQIQTFSNSRFGYCPRWTLKCISTTF